MVNLVWFRSDLRIADNPALADACGDPDAAVVAVYLVSHQQHLHHDEGPRRLAFLRAHVLDLKQRLAALGIPLAIEPAPWFEDVPDRLIRIARAVEAAAIYFNAEYPVNEQRRDVSVRRACERSGIACRVRHGDVIMPPGNVLKDDGSAYSVFTPFRRRWLERVGGDALTPLTAPRRRRHAPALPHGIGRDSALDRFPVRPDDADWPVGEAAAAGRLGVFVDNALGRYQNERDFPAKSATSRLSAYLSVGAISARTCYDRAASTDANPGRDAWLSELIWREFYRHVVVGFPHVSRGAAFRRELDALEWRDDPEGLAAWKAGETGYPLVDAGMRELDRTGFMHNRLRMITAMFLSKHLLIDWREGERHFMHHLRDADFASNNGGWQWSASTGTDAAPYFRIFNPASQARKFDPHDAYVRRYVPELVDGHRTYPEPIVEHRCARERALQFFSRA